MSRAAASSDHESTGPGMIEVTLGALLSVGLGAILAAGYLVLQPVDTVASMPREPDPDKVYYVTGSARASSGKGWLRKKQLLLEPGAVSITLSEDELNTWLASSEMQAETAEEEAGGIISTQRMNFRIADDMLQVGLPCEVSLPGFNQSVIVQTRGVFTPKGDMWDYTPSEIMVGGLAVHYLPVVRSVVVNRLKALHDVPDELIVAWKTLSEARVEGNRLVLVRQ